MSARNKRRPARPHWEKVTRRHAGGADTLTPDSSYAWLGNLKTGTTKKEPGK